MVADLKLQFFVDLEWTHLSWSNNWQSICFTSTFWWSVLGSIETLDNSETGEQTGAIPRVSPFLLTVFLTNLEFQGDFLILKPSFFPLIILKLSRFYLGSSLELCLSQLRPCSVFKYSFATLTWLSSCCFTGTVPTFNLITFDTGAVPTKVFILLLRD